MEKYTVGPLVGHGSFGSVVLVTRREDGAQFVMKRLPIHNVTEKEMEAYQNEIRLLSELVSMPSHVFALWPVLPACRPT